MRSLAYVLAFLFIGAGVVSAADMTMVWAYHDDNDDVDDRGVERVPGEGYTFIGNGGSMIDDSSPVILYVMTDHDFADERDEQVFVRWWNGEQEFWIMGTWEKNIRIGEGDDAVERFHSLPRIGSVMVDLWKVEIPAENTRPGENFYVIQLKGWSEDDVREFYLLRDTSGLTSEENELGQAWTPDGDYFGHDWSVTIIE